MSPAIRWHRQLIFAALVLGISGINSPCASPITEDFAKDFVDSVGLNIHLHYADTPYANFPEVKRRIVELGVKHLRDGLIDTKWQPYYSRFQELGKLGIKTIFISSASNSDDAIVSYPTLMESTFEGFEAPNESDAEGDDGGNGLTDFMARLARDAQKTGRSVLVGPSFTKQGSLPNATALAATFDWANLHNYFAGRNPGTEGWGDNGYGSYRWQFRNLQSLWPNKPVVTTETGYTNFERNPDSVPEDVAARYLPRLLLEQWKHNIKRTYLYELIDIGLASHPNDEGFGLLRKDLTPKPAYRAVRNLLNLLQDASSKRLPEAISVTITGDTDSVEHLLFAKSDGSHWLAMWVELPCYQPPTRSSIVVKSHLVRVAINGYSKGFRYTFDDSGEIQTREVIFDQLHPITIDDHLSLIRMGNR